MAKSKKDALSAATDKAFSTESDTEFEYSLPPGFKNMQKTVSAAIKKKSPFRGLSLFDPYRLQTMDGETLAGTILPPCRNIASSFIPEGLAIFGGAPKIGKSWLMLWLCLQIARGEPVWGFETQKGSALYLALEDSFGRLQSRLLEITEEVPSNVHFAVASGRLDSGLEKQIEGFMGEHPDTVLVVIDTLQKIRKETGSNNQYSADYTELGTLQKLAQNYHICIMVVHHLRKLKDDDPMNMLSGTTGLSGAVDSVYVLEREKRTENKARLFCTGRDIESLELSLLFNRDKFIWELCNDSDIGEVRLLHEDIRVIAEYFSASGCNEFVGTATELSEDILKVTGKTLPPATIRKRLLCYYNQFCELGFTLDFKRTHDKKLIEIKKICVDASIKTTPAPVSNKPTHRTQEAEDYDDR